MDVLWILALSLGGAALITGTVFFFVYKNVKKYTGNMVMGRITDLTWNAEAFNSQHGEGFEYTNDFVTAKFGVGGRSYMGGPQTMNTYHKVYTYTVDGVEYTRAEGIRYSNRRISYLSELRNGNARH